MKNNIILVGMPASGKTTISELLAQQLLSYTLYDTDSIIEKTNGIKIYEIFEKYSENYFRQLEAQTIETVTKGNNRIISVGGGAFENPLNRANLLSNGLVFYLKSDLDILYTRLSEDSTRPLLQNKNPKQILEMLYNKRKENYEKAHYIIDTSNKDENEIIKEILGIMHEREFKIQ